MSQSKELDKLEREIAKLSRNQIALGLADGFGVWTEELSRANNPESKKRAIRQLGLFGVASIEFTGASDKKSFTEPPEWVKVVRSAIERHASDVSGDDVASYKKFFAPENWSQIEDCNRSIYPHIVEPEGSSWKGEQFAAAVVLGFVSIKTGIKPPDSQVHHPIPSRAA